MTGKFLVSTQSLITIFSHLHSDENRVTWIRDPGYEQQIYLSDSYETIWGRPKEVLYDQPELWKDYLVGDNKDAFVQLLKSRIPDDIDQGDSNCAVLYQIRKPNNDIVYIKDSHFYLFDEVGNQVAVAGIAEAISELQWSEEIKTNTSIISAKDQQFRNQFIYLFESRLKLTARQAPSGILLEEKYQNYRHIITHNNQKVPLTKREIECLHYCVKGMRIKEIAKTLGLSPRTVETHFNHIREKTSCSNILQLIGQIKGFAV